MSGPRPEVERGGPTPEAPLAPGRAAGGDDGARGQDAGPPLERARALVDLSAIEHNARRLRSLLAGDARLCVVVKAEGYGHGAVESARAAQRGGATWLAVATGPEAAALRRGGVEGRVLVMGALTPGDVVVAAEADADVVAWDPAFVEELARVADRTRRNLRVHVKLDTGMGRLGASDIATALEVCDRVAAQDALELAGVMTHLATADEVGDDHLPAQLRAFEPFVAAARAAHPGVIAHAANSAATYRARASHYDMVRCGIAVYGLDPFHGEAAARDLRPALALESYVATVKRFRAGDSAGYGRRWRAPRDTSVGVLPIGYADGVRRGLSNNGEVLVGGRRCPLVGTVSMDNVTVELGPETAVRAGERAVFIGAQGEERITCEEVAERLATINYEVVCGLGARVVRRYWQP